MKEYVINGNVKDKVASLIANTSPDYFKNARALSKSLNMDAKFNRWLATQGKMGISFFDDAKRRENILKAIAQFTSIEEKQATVIAMLSEDIESIVAAKDAEVTKGLVLTNEQKEAHAEALVKFSNHVKRHAQIALIELGLALGVVEIGEKKEEAAKAEPAKVAP